MPQVRPMNKISEVIVVEGRYDKNTLSQVVDAVIIETSGFGVFNNKEKQQLLRTLAEKCGMIVLTDSDGAGFVIRNFIKGCVDPRYLKHAYIPDVYGKERRKAKASKEGKPGVEGMKPEVLLDALIAAGATVDGVSENKNASITKADMYAKGYTGRADSAKKRSELLKTLGLPEKMTGNALLDVLNALMTRDEFLALVN